MPNKFKEPWQITRDEFITQDLERYRKDAKAIGFTLNEEFQKRLSGEQHEKVVRKALSIGKPVPSKVLADYPDLAIPSLREMIVSKTYPGAPADIDVKWHVYKEFVDGLKPLVDEIDRCMRTFSYGEVKQMAIAEKIRSTDEKIYMCKELIGKGWRVNGKRLVQAETE